MRIISWNVNGLRAGIKRGLLEWLEESGADIVCLQEAKISPSQLTFDLLYPKNYFSFFNCAKKPGYSGVVVYIKKKPLIVETKIGLGRFDGEGRMLRLDFDNFALLTLYLPHGGRKKENLGYKLEVYRYLLDYFKKLLGWQKNLILIGDFNIAHKEIDLAQPKENKNNIMFTLEEREKLDRLVALDFVDSFRKFHKDGGHYTWWPYFANARARNLGWRIDYAFISRSLLPNLKDAFILSEVTGSDHCPIGIEVAS